MVISPFLPWGAGLSDLSTVTQNFIIFLAAVHGMWDLSSPTRGQTHARCSRSSKSLTTGPSEKFLRWEVRTKLSRYDKQLPKECSLLHGMVILHPAHGHPGRGAGERGTPPTRSGPQAWWSVRTLWGPCRPLGDCLPSGRTNLCYDELSWWMDWTFCWLLLFHHYPWLYSLLLPSGLPWLLSGFRDHSNLQAHFRFPNLTWKLELFLWSLSRVISPWKSSFLLIKGSQPLTLPRNLASLQLATLSVINSGKKKLPLPNT